MLKIKTSMIQYCTKSYSLAENNLSGWKWRLRTLYSFVTQMESAANVVSTFEKAQNSFAVGTTFYGYKKVIVLICCQLLVGFFTRWNRDMIIHVVFFSSWYELATLETWQELLRFFTQIKYICCIDSSLHWCGQLSWVKNFPYALGTRAWTLPSRFLRRVFGCCSSDPTS